MFRYINRRGKEVWSHTLGSDLLTPSMFYEVDMSWSDSDKQWAFHTKQFSITVVDRMTGYGNGQRDIETGFRDKFRQFWLASGGFDIREYLPMTINDAIAAIKRNANTCVGKEQ